MRKNYPKKTVYYSELTDNIEGDELADNPLPQNYQYIKEGKRNKFLDFLLYRIVATPLAFLYSRLISKDKIIGAEKIKPYKSEGGFLFGNHTSAAGDAFLPGLLAFPKRNYIIISRRNLSLPFGKALSCLGGLPLPDGIRNAASFTRAIKTRVGEGSFVTVYPEGRLWSFCSFLRPFGSESFSFASKSGKPAFAFTRVYKKWRFGVRSVIYIDGPFFPDSSLGEKDAREVLASQVKNAMEERLKLSDVQVVKYEKREENRL